MEIDDQILKELYPIHTNRDIAKMTGYDYGKILSRAKALKLKKNRETRQRAAGQTVFTDKMISYIKENHDLMSNAEMAKALNVRLTVFRNKKAELGLKKMELEYFTKEQSEFLLNNFERLGNVELAEYYNQHWPKKKKWTKNHFSTKLRNLKLKRSESAITAIVKKNSSEGGRSYTINRNSSSLNLHPSWIACQIAWRNPELRAEVLKHPELIEAKKNEILIRRKIKSIENGKK